MAGSTDAVTIRRLWPADRRDLREHLLRLDPISRGARFGGHVGDAFLWRYADAVDWTADVVVGAWCGVTLRGIAEVRRTRLSAGEVALSVEPGFQNRGIGTKLFGRAALAARNSWVTELILFCRSHNSRTMHIASRYSADLRCDRGEVTGSIRDLPPTPLSLCMETAAEFSALMQAMAGPGPSG